MIKLDEIKEVPKTTSHPTLIAAAEHNQKLLLACTHRVMNKEYLPHCSSYPYMTPLEADLMELMGDSLGG